MSAFERQYTPQELAELWKFHPTTITRMFEDEPGVMVHGRENRRDGKRQYRSLRIPESVAKMVYEEKVRSR